MENMIDKTLGGYCLVEELGKGGYGARARLVRINGFDTNWGRHDIQALKDQDFGRRCLYSPAQHA